MCSGGATFGKKIEHAKKLDNCKGIVRLNSKLQKKKDFSRSRSRENEGQSWNYERHFSILIITATKSDMIVLVLSPRFVILKCNVEKIQAFWAKLDCNF